MEFMFGMGTGMSRQSLYKPCLAQRSFRNNDRAAAIRHDDIVKAHNYRIFIYGIFFQNVQFLPIEKPWRLYQAFTV
jgi:hypothetical protein